MLFLMISTVCGNQIPFQPEGLYFLLVKTLLAIGKSNSYKYNSNKM